VTETCINPTEINEGDLMAYVDGTADQAVVEHVRRCPACAHQARELATLQAMLTARLYRASCPTPDQLIAYQRGELRDSEKLVVAQHVRQCPHCARELAALVHEGGREREPW
jgi:anti-sigma factor RsiW